MDCIELIRSAVSHGTQPTLATTTPAAKLAIIHDSVNGNPDATPNAIAAITVSPAPVTSKTFLAKVGTWVTSFCENMVIPFAPWVKTTCPAPVFFRKIWYKKLYRYPNLLKSF